MSKAEIEEAEDLLRIGFPADLREFLIAYGGGEGWWGESYLKLHGPAEMVEAAEGLQAELHYPDLLVIGSDGGGEMFALVRSTGRYVMTPFIGDEPSTRRDAGGSLAELLAFVERGAEP